MRSCAVLAVAVLLASALPAASQTEDTQVNAMVALMRMTAESQPGHNESQVAGPGETVAWRYGRPGGDVIVTFKVSALNIALPGSLPQRVRVVLTDSGGRKTERSGVGSVSVEARMARGNVDPRIEVQNTGTMPVSVKVELKGREVPSDAPPMRKTLPSPSPTPATKRDIRPSPSPKP